MGPKKKAAASVRWDDDVHGKLLLPYIENGTLNSAMETADYKSQIYEKHQELQFQTPYNSKSNAVKFLGRYNKSKENEGKRRGKFASVCM